MSDRLRITTEDLPQEMSVPSTHHRVELPRIASQESSTSLWRSGWFYYPVAALAAAIIGAVTGEILFVVTGAADVLDRGADETGRDTLIIFASFAITGGCIASALAAVELFVVGARQRALRFAAVGLALGSVAGPIALIAASILIVLAGELTGFNLEAAASETLPGLVLYRCLGWSMYGAGVGLASAIPSKIPRAMLLGAIGGCIGGLVAGAVFDPLVMLTDTGYTSRIVGGLLFACSTALFIVSASQVVRQAWLRVLTGPLTGKQFMLYRDMTSIGCRYESDVFLYKDAAIQPLHATINRVPGGHELVASGPSALNGVHVMGAMRVQPGDQIQLGSTLFEYHSRK